MTDTFDTKEVALIHSDEENIVVNSNDELDFHIEEMIEKNAGMWECKVCGKTNKLKQPIKRHAEAHIEGISHSCQICSKSSSTRNALQVHIKDFYSQQLFNCNICGKLGMAKITFKSHKMTCKPAI
jgi:uncharacterized Zn finger protein